MSIRGLTVQERFWSKVNKTDGCWEWTAARDPRGYGKFKVRSYVLTAAHRFAYELAYSGIPAGLCICHHCDNPACVRPNHLFAGTYAENVADMIAKGRQAVRARTNKPPRQRQYPVTHCVQGHEYTEANTYRSGKRRNCRRCAIDRKSMKRRDARMARQQLRTAA